jgi:hypothetical protein
VVRFLAGDEIFLHLVSRPSLGPSSLITHLHLVLRLRLRELYLHSPFPIHGVVLNHTGFTLIIIIKIKGCSVIFIPILRHIFNLSLTQQYLPTVWKEAAIVPMFERGSYASVNSCSPISIISNFSELLEFITHDHILHYVKLNPNQHGFTRTSSTVTNLVTFFDFMTPVVCGQREADAVCFDLSNAFDIISHNMLLHKLSCFGFSDGYISWLRSYLTNRQTRVRVPGTLSLPFQVICRVLCPGAFHFHRVHR